MQHEGDAKGQVPACGDQVDLARRQDAEIDARAVDERLGEAVPDEQDAVAVGVGLVSHETDVATVGGERRA